MSDEDMSRVPRICISEKGNGKESQLWTCNLGCEQGCDFGSFMSPKKDSKMMGVQFIEGRGWRQ